MQTTQPGSVIGLEVKSWSGSFNIGSSSCKARHKCLNCVRTARGRSHNQIEAEALSFALITELTVNLEDIARQEGCTVFMVLLAAFQILLGRHSGQDDILVGSPMANRGQLELESSLGYFVNVVILRGRLAGNPTFRQYLRAVRQATLDAFDHQHVPFETLAQTLHPERHATQSLWFQALLVWQNFAVHSQGSTRASAGMVAMPSGRAMFDLILTIP